MTMPVKMTPRVYRPRCVRLLLWTAAIVFSLLSAVGAVYAADLSGEACTLKAKIKVFSKSDLKVVKKKLNKGEKVNVSEQKPKAYRVQAEHGEGWVSRSYLGKVCKVIKTSAVKTKPVETEAKPVAVVAAATLKFLEVVEVRRELDTLGEGARKVGEMLMGFVSTMNTSAENDEQNQALQVRLGGAKASMVKCLDSGSLQQSFSAAFASKLSAEQSVRLTDAYGEPAASKLLLGAREAATPEGSFAASAYFRETFTKLSKARAEQLRMLVAASRYVDTRNILTRNLMPAVLKIQHEKMSDSQLQNKILASQDEYVMEGLASFSYGTKELTDSELATVLKLYATPDHRAYIASKNQALAPITENLFQCLLSSLTALMPQEQ
jgi:hypothetical protein